MKTNIHELKEADSCSQVFNDKVISKFARQQKKGQEEKGAEEMEVL
jgi:hypothetical protein